MRITNGMTARAVESDFWNFRVRIGRYGLLPYPGKEKSRMLHAGESTLAFVLNMARCALFGFCMKLR